MATIRLALLFIFALVTPAAAQPAGKPLTIVVPFPPGSVFHLMGELFNQTAGVRINHVPYRGSAPALQDVIAGHIPMAFVSIPNALTLGNAGSVKILAVLEPMRFARRPEIQSMSEAVPAFRKPSSWFGVFGPAGLPAPMTARLNSEIVKALATTDTKAKLDENGMAVI